MQNNIKARGAGDAGAFESVQIGTLNILIFIRLCELLQPLVGYSAHFQLLFPAEFLQKIMACHAEPSGSWWTRVRRPSGLGWQIEKSRERHIHWWRAA